MHYLFNLFFLYQLCLAGKKHFIDVLWLGAWQYITIHLQFKVFFEHLISVDSFYFGILGLGEFVVIAIQVC